MSISQRLGRPAVPVIVLQHVEEAALLRLVRSRLVRSPHVRLLHLGRLDERIAAHLDGVQVAGRSAVAYANQALERLGPGELFVATFMALQGHDEERLAGFFAIGEASPQSAAGLLSAFGWASAARLRGMVRDLLEAKGSWSREVGLAACGMHVVDPGLALERAIVDGDPRLRARALRTAGRCGRSDLIERCVRATVDDDEYCAFEGARSALLLGDRAESLAFLEAVARGSVGSKAMHAAALQIVLKVIPAKRSQALLASLAKDADNIRALIRGLAVAGDPQHVPWLIAQMDSPKLARPAGEAFSLITGVDLAFVDLDRKPPQDSDFGATDDPDENEVALDDDESLPWPDRAKIEAWWSSNRVHFRPGTRYFVGQEPTPAACLRVLKNGFQRQRAAAAEYRSLLTPGTPLFNVAAPSWRQQRWLAQMAPEV